MRVTSNSDYMNAMAGIERSAADLARWQAQVSSGSRLQVPSDDPAAAARAIAERGEIATLDQYARAAEAAATRLTAADAVLSDIVLRLTTARATATSALGTVATAAQREAAASELEGIAASLLSDLNSSVRGVHLFAGSAALTAPYSRLADGSVSAYQGDGNEVAIDVDRERSVRVAFDGRTIAQGSDAEDVFSCIATLARAVREDDQAGISAGLEGLTRAFDRAVAFQTAVGTDLAGLADQSARLGALRRAGVARVSRDEDANMAEALTQMARADAAYQAALASVGTRSRLTLLDYLR